MTDIQFIALMFGIWTLIFSVWQINSNLRRIREKLDKK